jgi:PAS domain S-box-containing protein
MSSPNPAANPAFTPEHLGLDTLVEFVEASLDGIVIVDPDARYMYANPVACNIMGYSLDQLVGQDFRVNFPKRMHQPMIDAFSASIDGNTGRYSSVILRPDGEEREIEYSNMRFEVDGQTILSAIFHDVTDIRRQAREASTLAEIASTMTVNLSMEETVGILAESVVKATTAIASAVIIVDLELNRFQIAGVYNLPDEFKEGLSETWPPSPTSPTMIAFRTNNHQIRHNARARILKSDIYTRLYSSAEEAEWDTLLATPMSYRGKPVGALMTFYPENWVIGDDELAFLKAIADQAAVTIKNTHLFQEAQSKAALEERQHLSRELHDSVSQVLYGIALGATTARRLLDSDAGKAREPLDYVLTLAEAGLAEMRALIFDLRPESLETEGLVAALEKQAAYLRARHHIHVEVEMCCEPDIPLEIKETVYHIAQEALYNTVKHARATEVLLCLEDETANILTMRLQDNGIGFDPDESFEYYRGLKSMKVNAQRLGGDLRISSTPGGGTLTRVDIPVASVQ